MLRARIIAVAFVAGLLATLTATGQPNPVVPTNLALEVHFYPGEPPAYIAVSPANATPPGGWSVRFKRVPGWTPPAGAQPVHAVNIQETLVGDLVRVSVSVFLGVKFEEERDVAVYTLHEGEKVTLRDLHEFGLEPFDVALVRV